jgi:uncharacterized protein
MILPDVNLLLYVHDEATLQHTRAFRWWSDLTNGTTPVGMPWHVLMSFARLAATPTVMSKPLQLRQSLAIAQSWFGSDVVHAIDPTSRHMEVVAELLKSQTEPVSARLLPDLQLAALAIEYGAEIHTNDVDFARFPGVRWYNPLTGAFGR